MGNKYVSDRSAVEIKVEINSGMYVVPNIVLPLEKGDGVWEPSYDKDESNPFSSHHGSKETTIITAFAAVDVSSKIKLPSNHALVAAAFMACGVSATVAIGTVSYKYDSNNKSTLSMKQTLERKSVSVYGARANFSLSCEVGQAAELSFNFKSMLKEVAQLAPLAIDNIIPSVPSFEKVYMTKDCAAYLVNGNTAHFKKINFSLGAEVSTPKDTCAGASYTQDIKPELQITMSVTQDNEDAFGDLKSGTEFNFVIPLFNMAGVKKWELIAPRCVVIEQKTPENESRLDVDRTLECRKVLGDDNFELRTYTA